MSKESTPLEVLKKIGKLKVEGIKVIPEKATVSDYVYYSIIETALKENEELKERMGITDVVKEDFIQLWKEHEVFEIIKPYIEFYILNERHYLKLGSYNIEITKEEYDLLKEVLL